MIICGSTISAAEYGPSFDDRLHTERVAPVIRVEAPR
jgi:hypothetical protein